MYTHNTHTLTTHTHTHTHSCTHNTHSHTTHTHTYTQLTHTDLQKIKAYIDSFRYGSYPHAGGGIG